MLNTVWQLDPAQLTPYYNIALCDALSLAGMKVRYITSRYIYDDYLPLTDNFVTDTVYFRGLQHFKKQRRLRQFLRGFMYPLGHIEVLRDARRNPPDIMHIQWSRLPRIDLQFVKRIKSLNIPIVHTVHDIIPSYATTSPTTFLNQIYSLADMLIVHTKANQSDFHTIYSDIDPSVVRVIPMIHNPDTAVPADANQHLARSYLGLPNNAIIFGFFGSIRHYKGVDILLQAYEKMAGRDDIHLLIAGNPITEWDRVLLNEAEKLPNIHIHAGYISYSEVWRYHMACDVMIFPYREITQSAALISAMGYGKAVVVTDVGGLPESIDDNGWIVPSEDPIALAQAMLEAADNREQTLTMGERSLAIITQKHGGESVAKEMLKIYREVSAKHSS